jgi:hypothetical protein
MKKLFVFFAAAMLLWGPNAQARQQKIVRVRPGFATVIVCPAPPELVSVGNSQQFTVQNSGNYILVKPTVSSGSTNMFIKAGMDSYNLVLKVSDSPDLEIRLLPTAQNRTSPSASEKSAPEKEAPADGRNHSDLSLKNGALSKTADLGEISPKARAILTSYFKTPRRYTYSVKNSDVILALDHMVQIEDKLYMICTLVNNSKIPYDLGYIRFKLVDQNRSLVLFKKKIKETEIEPVREFYNPNVKPNATGRLLFVFDKQGFSDKSAIEIKCTEESGRRELVMSVPGSYVE